MPNTVLLLLLLGRYLKFQNKTEGLDFKSYVTTSRILTLDKPEPDVTDLWILDFDGIYFFITLLFLADIEIQIAIPKIIIEFQTQSQAQTGIYFVFFT